MAARRKWLAIGVFLAVLALAVLSVGRTKPVYQARATLMVTASNPSDILGGPQTVFWSNLPNTSNHVALLQSRSVAERVAERLPDSLMLSAGELQSMVSARTAVNTDLITLVATARSAAVAVAVANAFAEAYQQYDLDLSRLEVSATRQFIENQLVVVGGRLDSFERSLAQFKSANKSSASIDDRIRTLIERQSALAAQYQQAVIDAEVSQAELAQIQTQIEREGKAMADVDGISSPLVSSLKGTLNQLEVEKTNLIIRGFGESSERIQGLNRRIDSTRARLRTESQVLIARQGFVDPVGHLSNLFESALDLGNRLTASKARQEALADAISSLDAPLARLPEAERNLARLTRDVETGRSVHSLLSGRYEEARIREVGRISSVRIIDLAKGAGQTGTPVRSRLSFGLMLALAVAVGSIWVAEYLDTSVHGPRDLQRRGYSVLGSIPQLLAAGTRRRRDTDVTSHLITHTDPESAGAEAFRMLRAALAFVSAERTVRTIAVTSPGPGEGKSTVAVNLASVLAQAGSRVLLVDADLRRPTLNTVFKRSRTPGLTDLVISDISPSEAVFATGLDGLFCLPTGTTPSSPGDLLVLSATSTLLQRLAGEYDYVVIDTPPVLVAADAPVIGTLVDATIMVVRARRTTLDAIDHAHTALLIGGARPPVLVLNDVSRRSGRYGRYYHYYGHYYRRPEHIADATRPGEGLDTKETEDTKRRGG